MAQSIEAILHQGPADVRDYTPGGATSAGQIREREDGRVGVAVTDIAASALGSEYVSGVFKVKASSKSGSKGDPIYWDATGDTALVEGDTIESADFYIGPADADFTTNDDHILVDINANRAVPSGVSS